MSLADVTSRCFQNGLSAQKWLGMCRLVRQKLIDMGTSTPLDFEGDLSNSILTLFQLYPADLSLRAYIRCALESELLSLPTFVITFLQAAKSPSVRDAGTINMLCELIQEVHGNLHFPLVTPSLQEESSHAVLMLLQESLAVLQMCSAFSLSRRASTSIAWLVNELHKCIIDTSQITTTEAMIVYTQVHELVNSSLDDQTRAMLDNIGRGLRLILGDDAKMAQEAQMMQTIQLTYGKGDALGPNSPTDTVTCSLMLRHLLSYRSSTFSSANTNMALVMLLATFRSTLWTPLQFYTQLFLSAMHCLSQSVSNRSSALLWKSFIVTRLPTLLPRFEQLLNSEHVVDQSAWPVALESALLLLNSREELLMRCDTTSVNKSVTDEVHTDSDVAKGSVSTPTPTFRSLLQYLVGATKLLDASSARKLDPLVQTKMTTQLGLDSSDSGLDLDSYVEAKLVSETNGDDALIFLQRAVEDIFNHPCLARVVEKRFITLCNNHDIEGLGHLCRGLSLHDTALEILSLHISVVDLVSRMLAFVEDYDCESVGDPQTAVGHLGNVILFLQSTLVRYELSSHTFSLGDRQLRPGPLLTTSTVFRFAKTELSAEEQHSFRVWYKALFDSTSEGIDDSILRATKPKTLLKLSSSLIFNAITACSEHKIEMDVLNNGVSYFTGPLLNWTLVGVIKALLRDIFQKDFANHIHLEVLQTLVQSTTCPKPVLHLTAHGILSLMTESKAQHIGQSASFDAASLRAIAHRALGTTVDNAGTPDSHAVGSPQILWIDFPRTCVENALVLARSGGAPSLEVSRCVAVAGPLGFLQILWKEISKAASKGDQEHGRRLAGYALTCPPMENAPPLLPVFLFCFLPGLLTKIDAQLLADQGVSVELLVSIISFSLTALLHIEWALRVVEGDKRQYTGEAQNALTGTQAQRTEIRVMGEPSASLALKLAADLKKSSSPTASVILQRLSSSQSFVANFPMFAS